MRTDNKGKTVKSKHTFWVVSKLYKNLRPAFVAIKADNDKIKKFFKDAVVIFDESHRLLKPVNITGPTFIDHMISYGLLHDAKKLIVMSGTPIINSLTDITKMLQFVSEYKGVNKSINNNLLEEGESYNFDISDPNINTYFFSKEKTGSDALYDATLTGAVKNITDALSARYKGFMESDSVHKFIPTIRSYALWRISQTSDVSLKDIWSYLFPGVNYLLNFTRPTGVSTYSADVEQKFDESLDKIKGGEMLIDRHKNALDRIAIYSQKLSSEMNKYDVKKLRSFQNSALELYNDALESNNVIDMYYWKTEILEKRLSEPINIKRLAECSKKFISFIGVEMPIINAAKFIGIDDDESAKVYKSNAEWKAKENKLFKYNNIDNITTAYDASNGEFFTTDPSIKYPEKVVNAVLIPYTHVQLAFRHKINNRKECKEAFAPLCSWYTLQPEWADINLTKQLCGNYSTSVEDCKIEYIPNSNDYVCNKKEIVVSEYAYSCPKFEKALSLLLLMKLGFMYDFANNEVIYQPHLVKKGTQLFNDTFNDNGTSKNDNHITYLGEEENKNSTHYYLPLVYSSSDILGLNLFAAFLKSRGLSYLLIHDEADKKNLKEATIGGFKSVYKRGGANINNRNNLKVLLTESLRNNTIVAQETINQIMSDKTVPICILLHPFCTEGFDAKYNPAIMLLEPARNYSDFEQVCGRVLRSYSNSYDKAPTKMVYQFIGYTPFSLHSKIKDFVGEPAFGIINTKNILLRNAKNIFDKTFKFFERFYSNDVWGDVEAANFEDLTYHLPEDIAPMKLFFDIDNTNIDGNAKSTAAPEYLNFLTKMRYKLDPGTFWNSASKWTYLMPNKMLCDAFNIDKLKAWYDQPNGKPVNNKDQYYKLAKHLLTLHNYSIISWVERRSDASSIGKVNELNWVEHLLDKLSSITNKNISYWINRLFEINFKSEFITPTQITNKLKRIGIDQTSEIEFYIIKQLIDIYTAFYDNETEHSMFNDDIINLINNVPTLDELVNISNSFTDEMDRMISIKKNEYFFNIFKKELRGEGDTLLDFDEITKCINNKRDEDKEFYKKKVWCEPLTNNINLSCFADEYDLETEKYNLDPMTDKSAALVLSERVLRSHSSKGSTGGKNTKRIKKRLSKSKKPKVFRKTIAKKARGKNKTHYILEGTRGSP
jgi:hypothetical protein